MSLLSAHNLQKSIGTKTVLDGVSITIEEQDRIGLLGRNGAGKSTLIRCLLGIETPDDGTVSKRKNLRYALVEQTPKLNESGSVGENILEGLSLQRSLSEELEAVEEKMMSASEEELNELIHLQADLGEQLDRLGGRSYEHKADAMLDALCAPKKDRLISSLSIGERRRVALAIGLLQTPDLLILDEPTNHLDVETIEWLEKYLVDFAGGILLVTHDRHFLEKVSTKMAEIDRGDLRVYTGSYSKYLEKKAERETIEARTEANRKRTISRELEWVRRGAPARTTKQKARLDRFEQLVDNVPKASLGNADFMLPHPPRIGKTILEISHLYKSYGDRKIIDDFDLILKKGDRIGIVGPNGAGKTTLLKMILGEVKQDSGYINMGQNTEIVYADQGRTDLDNENSVIEEVAGDGDKVFVGEDSIQVQTFLERLLFDSAQQRAKIGTLSGGERTRVALAKCLRHAGNLLILDEPTNDLDLATLRVLEDALCAYPGCVLVVSHDRWFLDRVSTSVLAFEGGGSVVLYEGGHADWRKTYKKEIKKPEPKEVPAAKPTQAKPKPKTPSRRRNFQQEKEFKGMEENIMELEEQIETLEKEVSDPEVIKELGPKLAKKLDSLEKKKAKLENLYARWAELSELEAY